MILLFPIAYIDTPTHPVTAPVRPAIIRHLKPAASWAKKVGVTVPLPNGSTVTTGEAEAVVVTQPLADPASYDLRICLQLRAAQPWMNWTCP